MTDRHVDEVPYHWFERNPRNPWYNRETHKVELPVTIKDRNNFVLTEAEHHEYARVLDEMVQVLLTERAKMSRITKALAKGSEPGWIQDAFPQPRTIAHALELMVKVAKSKLAVMEFFVSVCKGRNLGNER